MRWRWVVLVICGALGLDCEHARQPTDGGRMFLGDWERASGTREIDCGQGVVIADLASGLPDIVRFVDGAATSLLLLTPSTLVAPGLPGGPICQVAFQSAGDAAALQTESVCTGDNESIVVHEGLARPALTVPGELALSFTATTSRGCAVETLARCFPTRDR